MLQDSKREQDLLNHYNSNPSYYSSINNQNILELIRKSGLESLTGMNVLDIGCGDARLLPMIESMGIKKYTGIDYSDTRIEIAQKVATKIEKNIINTSIQNFINNNKETFDVIFIFEVLEHLEEPKIIMESLGRIGKKIIGSVPVNMPYKAHLQVYKSKKEVEEMIGCDVLFIKNGHFFFKD